MGKEINLHRITVHQHVLLFIVSEVKMISSHSPPPPSQSDSIRVCKKNNIVGLRGCLHGKTCTGASFIPGWLLDFGIMMTGKASVFSSSHVQRVEADKAILVCLSTRFHTKTSGCFTFTWYRCKISYRSEILVPVREPGWTYAGATRAGMTFCGGIM